MAGAERNSQLAATRPSKNTLVIIILYLLNEIYIFFLPLNFICVHISTIISKYIRIEKDQDNKILFSVLTIPTREILHYFKLLN